MPPLSVFYFTLDPEHETVCFSPFDLYPQTVCANLFPIFSSIFDAILLYNKHCAVFLSLKAGKSSNRLYSFFIVLKILPFSEFFKVLCDIHGMLYPIFPRIKEDEKTITCFLTGKRSYCSCISNSEKIESIERLRLKCASGAHTVQAFFQSKTKFKVRSGCLGPCFKF